MSDSPPVNILLVDDQPGNLLTLEAALLPLGQNLVLARSAEEALAQLLKEDFAAILLDVQMPDMDGYQLAGMIRSRERSQHTPLLFITAIDRSREHMLRGYELGAVDFLYKPFIPEVLRAKVRIFVELSRQAAAIQRESAQRAEAEAAVRELNEDLEQRVRERTRELAASEERYRWLLENTTEAIWRFDLDEPVPVDVSEDEQIERFYRDAFLAECNEGMAHTYGFDTAAELVGMRLGQFLVREDPANEAYLRAFIRAGYRLIDAESVETDRAGQIRYMLNNLVGRIEDGLILHAWGTTRDVTESRRADEALRESRERLRLALEAAQMGTWRWDLRTGLETRDESLNALLGLPPAETTGPVDDFFGRVHPDDRGRVREALDQALSDGGIYHAEYRVVRPDGAVRWLADSGRVARDPKGEPLYVTGACADVHERRLADAELRATHQMLRALIDASPLGLSVLSLDGRVEMWNPANERIFGWTADEVLGRIVPTVPAERVTEFQENLRRVHEGEPMMGVPSRRIRKDGTTAEVAIWAARLEDAYGNPRILSVIEDLTERRRLERDAQRLAAIVASSEDAIIGKDLAGIITSWNRGAEHVYGYPAEEALGRSIRMLIPDGQADDLDAIMARIRAGEAVRQHEAQRCTRDGRVIDVSLTISPIWGPHGDIVGASTIARDITENKRLRVELQRRADELAAADRRKDKFLAMLAHELRNPLAPIVSATQILRLRGDGDRALEHQRDVIERQVRHLSRLVDDLLEVSRINEDKIELRRELLDLRTVVEQAVSAAWPLAEERQHRLTLDLPPDPLPIHADPTRMSQVLINLLQNAVKYTEPGGSIWVTVEATSLQTIEGGSDRGIEGLATGDESRLPSTIEGERDGEIERPLDPSVPLSLSRSVSPSPPTEASSSWATVRVRDTGRGIAPELLPHVFDLFVQGDQSLARTEGGLGIGLTMVRRLVELHGGAVAAHSEGPGHGSEFVLSLPVAEGSPEEGIQVFGYSGIQGESSPEYLNTRIPEYPVSPPHLRVLVVEDNRDAAESLGELLELWGHTVELCHEGSAALDAVERFQPDVVLCDIGLPGMDGYTIARSLRSGQWSVDSGQSDNHSPLTTHHSPLLVALTGYGQEADREAARGAGFDQHLTKPFDPETLKGILAATRPERS